jgi:Rrf2 family nitric oxide-sensitive transcriptional repressor
MQLTRHTDYALRVLMYLGARPEELCSVAEISDYFAISRNHLVKVVQGLTEHGFVATTRGKYGGMQLCRDADKISVGAVVRCMENHFDIVECFDHSTMACSLDGACRLKHVLHHAMNNFLKELDGTSLADVLKPKLRKQLLNFPDNLSQPH